MAETKTKAKAKPAKETPLMGQYNRIKSKYPDALLLFRVGDFYETFGQDAIVTANVLGIVLTKRANGSASEIELAGFPHHALDTYLPKMVKAGYRVAICEQLEDPKATKTIVKRGVTELITPGVALNDKLLNHRENNFLAAVAFDKNTNGVAFLDISTGEFLVAEGDIDYIDKLLQGFQPSEVILAKNKLKDFKGYFGSKLYTYSLDEWIFSYDFGREKLLHHFDTQSLKGFGVEEMNLGIIAAGAAIHYLGETEHPNIKHINAISRIAEDKYVWLDKFTIRNLELFNSNHDGGTSLLDVLDKTISPMGARMMKKWLILPLKEKKLINDRLNVVEYFIKDQDLRELFVHQLKQIGDLERIISKVPLGKINPREVLQLKRALDAIIPIKEQCLLSQSQKLNDYGEQLNALQIIREKIGYTLTPDPPAAVQKGNVIADGVNEDLDDLRDIIKHGKERLVSLQQKEIEATGIGSLKIGFNNVFGYYLEVTNKYKNMVPDGWVRKQTLVNAERYVTDELKQYEEKIMGAEEKIQQLETQLFEELVLSLNEFIRPIQLNAYYVAQIDCLLAFAHNAIKNNYRRPEINDSLDIEIKEGRHPVIEQQLEPGSQYVANNIFLNNEEQQVIIITGPNMAGKSAILRQTALIVLMAQIGSFVPAQSAKIGLVDKIFTRVGASDNISSGESTFMVEMNETASILNNISERSLILLDEIGRGTSTYDGISIAWSIAEYLHNNPLAHPKTLFATHYHELNELADKFPRIHNYNISTKEVGNKVIFLRKLVPGGSKHSFGIHVAKMAGMPKAIVERANQILEQMEKKSLAGNIKDTLKKIPEQNYQLNIFQVDDPSVKKIKESLNNIDIDTLTPIEAMMKLNELKKILD